MKQYLRLHVTEVTPSADVCTCDKLSELSVVLITLYGKHSQQLLRISSQQNLL